MKSVTCLRKTAPFLAGITQGSFMTETGTTTRTTGSPSRHVISETPNYPRTTHLTHLGMRVWTMQHDLVLGGCVYQSARATFANFVGGVQLFLLATCQEVF